MLEIPLATAIFRLVRESLDHPAFQTAHTPHLAYVASSSSSALASFKSAVSKPSVNQL
jgi:hypothetical protein